MAVFVFALAVSGEFFFPFRLRRLRGVDGVLAAGDNRPGASGVTELAESVSTDTMVKKGRAEAAERVVISSAALVWHDVGGGMDQ